MICLMLWCVLFFHMDCLLVAGCDEAFLPSLGRARVPAKSAAADDVIPSAVGVVNEKRGAMQTIRGKKALVTGAASGIGRAIALALAHQGAELFLVDIDEANLRASACAAKQFTATVIVAVCDLSQTAE